MVKADSERLTMVAGMATSRIGGGPTRHERHVGRYMARRSHPYANSTANAVLEAVQFDLRTNALSIIQRADAEANKLRDIRQGNPGITFFVYCRLCELDSLKYANISA